MILSAQTIRKLCQIPRTKEQGLPMIFPFSERAKSEGRSYGLSSCGYDVRIAETIWLWPFWGRLASTYEQFNMPDNLCAEVKDKSTNARVFVLVQNTIIEPGWSGFLTLELTRFLPWPIKIVAGTPIAQVVFKMLDQPTEQTYSGKYQNQKSGPQSAILES